MTAIVLPVPRMMVPMACKKYGAHRVISISAQEDGEPPAFPARLSVLRLVVSDIHCGSIWSDAEVASTVAQGLTAPTADHVAQALDFARAAPDSPLVIHCTAGISRSPAIALAILADRLGKGRETEAVDLLFDTSDGMPNPGIVALADALLERDGALVAALNARPKDLVLSSDCLW